MRNIARRVSVTPGITPLTVLLLLLMGCHRPRAMHSFLQFDGTPAAGRRRHGKGIASLKIRISC